MLEVPFIIRDINRNEYIIWNSVGFIGYDKNEFFLLQEGDTHYNSMNSGGDNDGDENPPQQGKNPFFDDEY